MSRVLITGGVGPLGAAVTRRLLADPAYDVRISDERPAPRWMREGCEVHTGDLRRASEAAAATKGCSHVVHLACFGRHRGEGGGDAAPSARASRNGSSGERAPSGDATVATEGTVAEAGRGSPLTLLEYEAALQNAVIRAALDRRVARFLYVSSPLVFERAELFPTPEQHLEDCLPPRSASGFARLSGERHCAAAHREQGLEYVICRPFGAYGPPAASLGEPPTGERSAGESPLVGPPLELSELIERAGAGEVPLAIYGTGEERLTPTHVDDLAEGVVTALGAEAAANEDFNLAAARELSLSEIVQIAWRAGADASGRDQGSAPTLERRRARETELARSYPSAAKARELLGWEARTEASAGIAAVAAAARKRAAGRPAGTPAGD
ncbi:MAG TPA: NAD(P)-dependent oxidoreductase [Solirubrobacteraceae bacterium]|nr:NAD(P)-dependent oxidoreductase [Solirubrobacteraceae bacterium]